MPETISLDDLHVIRVDVACSVGDMMTSIHGAWDQEGRRRMLEPMVQARLTVLRKLSRIHKEITNA